MKQLKYLLKVNFNFTYLFIGICVILFILTWLPNFLSTQSIDADSNLLVNFGANYATLVASGDYFRLISSIFLHGSLIHLGFNMYALFSIGPFIETYFNRRKFFTVFIITGFVASLSSFLFNQGFSVGASGAIFGILGLLLAQSIGRNYAAELPIDKKSLIGIILINLVFGFIVPGVDNFAHLGGLISGFLLGLIIKSEYSSFDNRIVRIINNALLVIAIILSLYGLIGLLLNLFSH